MHFIREAKTNTAPADVPMRLGGSTWSRGLISASESKPSSPLKLPACKKIHSCFQFDRVDMRFIDHSAVTVYEYRMTEACSAAHVAWCSKKSRQPICERKSECGDVVGRGLWGNRSVAEVPWTRAEPLTRQYKLFSLALLGVDASLNNSTPARIQSPWHSKTSPQANTASTFRTSMCRDSRP